MKIKKNVGCMFLLIIMTLSLSSIALADDGPDYYKSYTVRAIEYDDDEVTAVYVELVFNFLPHMENFSVLTLHIQGESQSEATSELDYYMDNFTNLEVFVPSLIGNLTVTDDGAYEWIIYERCDTNDFHIFLTVWGNETGIAGGAIDAMYPSDFDIKTKDSEDDDETEYYALDLIALEPLFILGAVIVFCIGMLSLTLLPMRNKNGIVSMG